MNKALPISVLGALLAIMLAVAGAILYFERTTPRTDMTLTEFETAGKALAEMDYNTAIMLSNDGVKTADTDVQRMRYKLLLAESLWDRNQAGDRAQALGLYKEVALSENANSIHRALAFNDLAIIVNTTDYAYMQSNFTEPELRALVATDGTSEQIRLETFYNLLTHSIELFPTSFAEYAIAGNYYVLRIARGDFEDRSEAALMEAALEHVRKGDALNDKTFFSAYPLIKGYYYRALTLATSGRVLGSPSLEDREAAFKLVLDTATEFNITREFPVHGTVLSARFFYAKLLLDFAPSRTADIVDLLRPFAQINPSEHNLGIFTNYDTNPGAVKNTAPRLAAISSDFSGFLARVGVTQ